MKKIICMLLLITMLSACTSSTPLGQCVGIGDEGQKDLVYRTSVWNMILAVVFVETIVVPVVVLVSEAKCPEYKRLEK